MKTYNKVIRALLSSAHTHVLLLHSTKHSSLLFYVDLTPTTITYITEREILPNNTKHQHKPLCTSFDMKFIFNFVTLFQFEHKIKTFTYYYYYYSLLLSNLTSPSQKVYFFFFFFYL